jgi:hypothetical protein
LGHLTAQKIQVLPGRFDLIDDTGSSSSVDHALVIGYQGWRNNPNDRFMAPDPGGPDSGKVFQAVTVIAWLGYGLKAVIAVSEAYLRSDSWRCCLFI